MAKKTSETPWLDETEMSAWLSFIETIGDLQYRLDVDLKDATGLSSGDYQVLVYLSESPDRSMRMCDLANRLNLTPSGLTRRLDGLVKDGSVRRRPSPDDRRVQLAELTAAGYRRLVDAAPYHVRSVRDRFIDRLTVEQLRALAASFSAIKEGLSAS